MEYKKRKAAGCTRGNCNGVRSNTACQNCQLSGLKEDIYMLQSSNRNLATALDAIKAKAETTVTELRRLADLLATEFGDS